MEKSKFSKFTEQQIISSSAISSGLSQTTEDGSIYGGISVAPQVEMSLTVSTNGWFNGNFWRPIFDGVKATRPVFDELDSGKLTAKLTPVLKPVL